MVNHIKSKQYSLILAILYSFICVFILPWEILREGLFSDIENYIVRVEYLSSFGVEREFNGISVLFSEVLWKQLLMLIATNSNDYALSLKFVSFVSLVLYAFFCFRRLHLFLVIILLFNPLFIDLYMGQLRMSLAFAFALIAFELRDKKLSYFIIAAAVAIHASILLIIVIYWVITFFDKNLDNNKHYLISCIIVSFFIVIFLKFGIDFILLAVGDKRANYADVIESSSVKYTVFWFGLAILLTFKSTPITIEQRYLVGFSVLMMSLFFFSSLLGQYGQRFMAISIPIVVCSLSTIKGYDKAYIVLAIFLFQSLQIIYWMQLSVI